MLKIINRIVLGLCIFTGAVATLNIILVRLGIYTIELRSPEFIFGSVCFLVASLIYGIVSLIVIRVKSGKKLKVKNNIECSLICACSIFSYLLWLGFCIMIA